MKRGIHYVTREKSNNRVAGLGYVGLTNSILLAQNYHVIVTDISQERVNLINRRQSPLVDDEIIEYLANHALDLTT